MTHHDLTPDEVDSLLDETGPTRTEPIPLASASVSPTPSLQTSKLWAGAKSRRPSLAGEAASEGAELVVEEPPSSTPSLFALRERPSLEQLKTTIGRAAKHWSAALAQPLRTTVHLDVEDAQACHPGLGSQYELPGCIQVLQADPLGEAIYLQMDRGVVFGMLDRLLGGGKSPLPNVRRAITEIETSLLLRITASLLKALEGLFPKSATQSISTLRVDSNPQCVPLQQPAYYQLRIRVAWNNHAGYMRLVLPEVALRMLADDTELESDTIETIRSLPARGLSVVAGQIRLRRDEAMQLKEGDTIVLPRPHVRVYVDRTRMYAGKLGSVQQHKAVRIEESPDS